MAKTTPKTDGPPPVSGVSSIPECVPLLAKRAALRERKAPAVARRDAIYRELEAGPRDNQELSRPLRYELDQIGPTIADCDAELAEVGQQVDALARRDAAALAAPLRERLSHLLQEMGEPAALLASLAREVVEMMARLKVGGLPVDVALGLPVEQLRAPFPGERLTALQLAFLALAMEQGEARARERLARRPVAATA